MRSRLSRPAALVAVLFGLGCGSSTSGFSELDAGVDATAPVDASADATDATDATIGASADAGVDASDPSLPSTPNDAGDAASPDADADDAGDSSTDATPPDAGSAIYASGVSVSTLAGSDTQGAQNGTGGAAQFDNPTGIAIDSSGNLFVTDYDGSDVRLVTPAGAVSTIASATGFMGPFAIVVASDGSIYVETDFNSAAVKNATSGTIWTVVPVDGGVATPTVVARGFGRPRGLAPASSGSLVLSDRLYSIVESLVIDGGADGGVATFLAGSGDAGFADGTGVNGVFNMPVGAATMPNGDVLIADTGNNRIRRVTSGGAVSTFAGNGVAAWTDGPIAGAELNAPRAIAVDAAGDVFISDGGNHCIRRIRAAGDVVDTLAGDGTQGFRDGAGFQAELYGQEGIAVTRDGKTVYVTDGNGGDGSAHHRIREITIP